MILLETRPSSETEADAAHKNHSRGACPLCGNRMRPWMKLPGDWRRSQTKDAPVSLERCPTCEYGSVEPRPSLTELASFYDVDGYYTHKAPQDVPTTRTILDRLLEHLAWRADRGWRAEIGPDYLARHKTLPPAKVIDIGCGNGGLVHRLAVAGFDVVGIDPDADACRAARAGGLKIEQGSAEDLPVSFADAGFDAVTMMHVLEHVLNPVQALDNITRMLRRGGRLYVEVPNNACIGRQEAGATWRWLDVPRHLNFFTPESLQAFCRKAGLEIEAVEFTGYVRQFLSDWIADERLIHDRLESMSLEDESGLPRRNSKIRAWRLLAKTWRAPDAAKYDSVRIVARKP